MRKGTLEQAIEIATLAHEGQVDKQGEPYILHPLRVMLGLKKEEERIVAILHDTVEDTSVTIADLKRLGYSQTIVDAIDSLTRKNETYDAFIRRVKKNPLAIKVKLADLTDNTDLTRGPIDSKRLRKYKKAIATLKSPRTVSA